MIHEYLKNCYFSDFSKFYPSFSATPKFCDHIFKYLDEDNSGNIGFTEWAMADYLIVRATPAEKLGWAFKT